jgi:hypothetical protein
VNVKRLLINGLNLYFDEKVHVCNLQYWYEHIFVPNLKQGRMKGWGAFYLPKLSKPDIIVIQ